MFHRFSHFVLGVVVMSACASNTMLVRVDDEGPATREVQKQDCGVYDSRGEAMRVGVDFGLLFQVVRGGPYVEKAQIASMNWDKSVHHMVAQYKELCTRYNGGGISQAAYDVRVAEIDQFWAEAQGIRQNANDAIRGHGQASFNELERSTADTTSSADEGRQNIAVAIDALVVKLGAR